MYRDGAPLARLRRPVNAATRRQQIVAMCSLWLWNKRVIHTNAGAVRVGSAPAVVTASASLGSGAQQAVQHPLQGPIFASNALQDTCLLALGVGRAALFPSVVAAWCCLHPSGHPSPKMADEGYVLVSKEDSLPEGSDLRKRRATSQPDEGGQQPPPEGPSDKVRGRTECLAAALTGMMPPIQPSLAPPVKRSPSRCRAHPRWRRTQWSRCSAPRCSGWWPA